MATITKQYEQIIKKMQASLTDSLNGKQKLSLKAVREKYEKDVVKQIQKANGKLKIVMDNQFAAAILARIKEYENVGRDDFQILEAGITFLNFLTQVLDEVKFITTRERKRIEERIKKIKQSRWFKLNSRLTILARSDDRNDFRTEFFDLLGHQYDEDDQESAMDIYEKFYRDSLSEDNLDRKLFIKVDSIIAKFENRLEILGSELIGRVDQYFGQQIGKSDVELEINNFLRSTAESESLQSNQQHLELLQQNYEEIKKILNKFSAMRLLTQNLKLELHLARFGSIISGFATRNTDMDLTILTNCYVNEIQLLEYLQSFLKAEFKESKKCEIKFIRQARIPLLKLTLLTTKGTTAIDLIVNNILGVINSKFLAVYGGIPWIRQLGVLIKLWAKKKDLVDEQKFSSYSFNLMLLHFLMETGRIKLIMDARERSLETPHFYYQRRSKQQDQKFPVYFKFKTKPEDVTNLKRVNLLQLLTEFFEYYSEEEDKRCGKHWKFSKEESIITVDGSKAKQFEDGFIFTIKDPFDEKHNPGRVPANQKNLVNQSFNNAYRVLQSNNIELIRNLF